MKRFFPLAILFILSFTACFSGVTYAEATGTESDTIVEVVVTGPNVTSAERIKLMLRTKQGAKYDPVITDQDVKDLYARNLVEEVSVQTERVAGGLRITFTIVEKRTIAEISFQPKKALFFTTSKLKETVTSKIGDYYSFAVAAQDEELLRSEFKKKGFLQVAIKHRVEPIPGGLNLIYDVSQGQRYAVGDIVMNGNTVFTDRYLRRKILTKRKDLFHGGYLKEHEINVDADRIRALYLDKGYLDVKIEMQQIILPDPPQGYKQTKKYLFTIVFNITEGTQYRIGEISLTGETVFEEQELRSTLLISSGDAAELGKIEKSVTALSDLFGTRGRAFTDIRPEIVPAEGNDVVDIIFHIRQSDIISVNEVIIQGNDVTKDKVIRREIRVYPGEYLSMKDMRTSFRNLNNLGYFNNVTVSYARKSENVTDVVFTVEEGKTGSFTIGGGVTNMADVFLSLSYMQKNFDIGAWPHFKGAGQNFRISTNVGTTMTAFNIDFTEPHIFDSDYSFGIGASRTETDYSTFDDTRMEFHVSVGKRFSDTFSASLIYSYEDIRIDDISATAPTAIKMDEGKHHLGSLGIRSRWRNLDNFYIPSEGFDVRSDLTYYHSVFGSEFDFYKISSKGAKYWNMFTTKGGNTHTLSTSLLLGFMEPIGDTDTIPTFERFYCGGVNTVRGWQSREIGPRVGQDPIGGYFIGVASVEYYFPVYPDVLYFAAFFDAGGVWDKISNYDSDGLRYGTGVGVYIKTPLSPAPFKIYFCDALNPKNGEDDTLIAFSFGFTF